MNANSIDFESEDQIILVDKPAGISSFGAVAKVRGFLRTKFGNKVKVGHTGTLDPFATGLLILLSGKNTKRAAEFLKKDKIYEAKLKLGFTSTTGDPEGEIHEYQSPDDKKNTSAHRPTEPEIHTALQSFVGEIVQHVPAFSAVKINGERAYKLARAGKDFETPTRQVHIYELELLDYHYPELTIRCHVSSGTYIRTLAEDLGEALGTGAYLTALRRISIGDYNVKDAHQLQNML